MQGLRTMLDPLFVQGTARWQCWNSTARLSKTRGFTKDASLVEDDLQNLQPGDDGAAILDAVDAAVKLLKQNRKDDCEYCC